MQRALSWPSMVGVLLLACTAENPNGEGVGGGATAGGSRPFGGTGGVSAGSGGRIATGGNTGGFATGGTAQETGGRAAGGVATGGAVTGGKATGGNATGGKATGGNATGGKATGGNATGGTTGTCANAPGQLFPPGAPWNTAIDSAPLDSESSAVISYLTTNHTASARFRVDFSPTVLAADATTPHLNFNPTSDFYADSCDPAPVPVPSGGCLEGETGYSCASDGDCHLLVVDRPMCRLYEMWRADITGGVFNGGCLAVWQIDQVYPPSGRGENCTSADAAGLPIAPLLFTADEVAAGEIRHAIRFILPNSLMRSRIYVHPATHSTTATSGPSSAPPYGARMRLKASKSLSGLKPAAQVVAKALQKYGMILADGGNITFTAAADTFTTNRWGTVGFATGDLTSLAWADFEMVDGGQRFQYTGDCNHTPVTQ